MANRPKADSVKTGHPKHPAGRTLERFAVVGDVPDVPDGLAEAGTVAWEQLWKFGGGVYHPVTDYHSVAVFCSLIDRRQVCLRWLNEGRRTAEAIKLLNAVEREMRSWSDRLGLTPDSRLRLGIKAVEAASELEAFLNDGGD